MRALIALCVAGCLPDTYESDRTVEWEPPAPSAREVIETFQDCMQYSDFAASSITEAWSFQVAESGNLCSDCHYKTGMFSPDPAQFFFGLRDPQNFLLLFTFDPAGDGAVVDNRRGFERLQKDPDHPAFEPGMFEMQTLTSFTTRTNGRIARNDCPP